MSLRLCQNVAMMFTGAPVPPTTRIGAAVTRNIHRRLAIGRG